MGRVRSWVRYVWRVIFQRRRLERAAVATPFVTGVASQSAVLMLLQAYWGRLVVLMYIVYMLRDRRTPLHGGRPSRLLSHSPFWSYFRSYFPLACVKTVDLDPHTPYLLGIHPHGIWSVATWGNILTGDYFSELDGRLRVVTLSANFYIPLWRDFLLGMGMADASADSIRHLLDNKVSVGIVVGGAQEALDARPGVNDLTLHHRMGFVRLALEAGVPLVPVYSFGENDVYGQLVENRPGSYVRSLQEWFKEQFSFVIPLVSSVFPRRRPVTTVVGAPIVLPKLAHPTVDDITHWHEVYVKALQALFDEYHAFVDGSTPLRIVDRPLFSKL